MNSTTLSRHQTPLAMMMDSRVGHADGRISAPKLSSSDPMKTFLLGRCYWWAAVDIQTNGLCQEEEWSLRRSHVGPLSERCMKRWIHRTHFPNDFLIMLCFMISAFVDVFSRPWKRPNMWAVRVRWSAALLSQATVCFFVFLKMKVGDQQWQKHEHCELGQVM